MWGTIMSNNFQLRSTPTDVGVAKFTAGASTPVLEKVGGEAELGLSGRDEHRSARGAAPVAQWIERLPSTETKLLNLAVAKRPSASAAPAISLPPIAIPIAIGWSEPVPGRDFTRSGPAPFHGARERRASRQTRQCASNQSVSAGDGTARPSALSSSATG